MRIDSAIRTDRYAGSGSVCNNLDRERSVTYPGQAVANPRISVGSTVAVSSLLFPGNEPGKDNIRIPSIRRGLTQAKTYQGIVSKINRQLLKGKHHERQ